MQFDVHRNLGRGREVAPFLVDLQQVEIEQLRTTVVAPLVSDLLFKAYPRLTRHLIVGAIDLLFTGV